MILIELTAAIDADGTLQTYYVSDAPFQTAPTDSPADVAFDDTVINAGSIGLHAYSGGRTGGATLLETGDIEIANADGLYDAWKDHSFDSRRLVIRAGEGGPYPSAFQTLVSGTVASVEVGLETIIVRFMDKAALLDAQVLTTVFAGTNAGSIGLEGTQDDIKGQVVPRLYGSAEVIPAPCVNASLLIYRVSDRPTASISNVCLKGVPLTFGADRATSSALAAATIAAGAYDTCLAEGLFRLGSSPDGLVTADAAERANAEEMTVAALMARLVDDLGLSEGEVDDQAFAELNADAPYGAGLWLRDESTFRTVLDRFAQSVAAWYAFDANGVFRCGQLQPPGVEAQADILAAEVGQGFGRRAPDGDGIPVWRVKVRYRLFGSAQNDVAAAVDDERRAALAQEYRTVTAEDSTIRHKFAGAGELIVDTLLTSQADAQALADKLLAIHGVRRDLFDVPISQELFDQGPYDLMTTVRLTHPRFGLSGGRNLRVLGRSPELGGQQMILELWG